MKVVVRFSRSRRRRRERPDEHGTGGEGCREVPQPEQARGDHSKTSDVDVIVVSPDFEGLARAHRGRPFRAEWEYERYGPVDFIEYSPDEYREYREYRERPDSLIRAAEEQGVRVV